MPERLAVVQALAHPAALRLVLGHDVGLEHDATGDGLGHDGLVALCERRRRPSASQKKNSSESMTADFATSAQPHAHSRSGSV